MCAHVYVYGCMSVHIWKPEVNVVSLFGVLPTSFETLVWSLLIRLVPGTPEIFPSSPYQH